MARTRGSTVDKIVKPLKEKITDLESELETKSSQNEALIQDRHDLKIVVGLEKSKVLDTKTHYDSKFLELEKREKEIELEVSNKLKPIQGKYSQLQIDYRQKENQLSSFERRITDLESELEITMKGKMDESPEALTILHILYDQNEIYNELSTNFDSNLENIIKVKKLRTNDAKYTLTQIKNKSLGVTNDTNHCLHSHEDHEYAILISNRKHTELYSKAIKNNLSRFKNWDDFNEYSHSIKADFSDGVSYTSWLREGITNQAKAMEVLSKTVTDAGGTVKIAHIHLPDDYLTRQSRKLNVNMTEETIEIVISKENEYLMQDALNEFNKFSTTTLLSDFDNSPISKERHDEIFRNNDDTRYSCSGDLLSRAEVNLIIHDKLDEKSYNQLSKDYQDMVNSGTIFLSDMDNITIARDKMLGLSE